MTSLDDKNVLSLIALSINDKNTWYAFALVCKKSANAVRTITLKRSKNYYYYSERRHTEFFQMSLEPEPKRCNTIEISRNDWYPMFNTTSFTTGSFNNSDNQSYNIAIGENLNIRNRRYSAIDISAPESSVSYGTSSFLWKGDNTAFTTNGHKTFAVCSTGRGGEGIRFNNGAKGELTSKRYNDNMTWSYKPSNPEHWGGFSPPTSLAEACDRLAAMLFKLSGPVP